MSVEMAESKWDLARMGAIWRACLHGTSLGKGVRLAESGFSVCERLCGCEGAPRRAGAARLVGVCMKPGNGRQRKRATVGGGAHRGRLLCLASRDTRRREQPPISGWSRLDRQQVARLG